MDRSIARVTGEANVVSRSVSRVLPPQASDGRGARRRAARSATDQFDRRIAARSGWKGTGSNRLGGGGLDAGGMDSRDLFG
jgi:hypothetical protein